MNQLHENLYELLIELDEVCKKHDIKYYLAGGSALGALRNHCFLPWDDDIDLYITRDNWNKLKNLIESNENVFSKNRKLVYTENAIYHRNPIIRLVNTDTTVIYSAQSFSGLTCGQQVELFVLDPIPNDEEERMRHIDLHRVYLELLSPFFVVNKNLSVQEFEKHYKLYNYYYKKCKVFGYKKVLKELENKLFSYKEEECDDFCLRWGIRVLIHKKEFYEGVRTELLEDREFPVAYKLEHAMRVDYGDSWMYIPKGDGKISHNPLIENLEKPFERYTDIYLPKIDRERVIKTYTKNKHNNMQLYVKRREIEADEAKIKTLIIENQYKGLLVNKTQELKKALENREYDIIDEFFSDYYSIQLSKNVRRYNILVDIGDDNLYIAIMNYIAQGKYFTANNILKIREIVPEALTSELEECRKIINWCKELSLAIYDEKDIMKVKEIIKQNIEGYSEYLDIYRAILWVKEHEAESEADWNDIIAIGEKAIDLYPFDGEIMSFVARALLMTGKTEAAKEMYDKAIHNTRNGFVWNKAKRDVGLDRMLEE